MPDIPDIRDLIDLVQGAMSGAVSLVALVIGLIVIAGFWKTFDKAGKPPWGVLVPIYNIILIADVAGRSILWAIVWMVLWIVPLVGWLIASIMWFIMMHDIALRFGKGLLFAIGLFFFLPLFIVILGFGKAEYR
jgi:hypothetical protein